MLPHPATPDLPPAATAARTNWSGNYTYIAQALDQPTSIVQVQQLIRRNTRLKALGSRHSFNAIADTPGTQITLTHLDTIALNTPTPDPASPDPAGATVTVGAGITYGQLAPWLHNRGFALHNLASLPHISVAGGTATATHGSGITNGNLATAVTALDLVTPDGQLHTLSRRTPNPKSLASPNPEIHRHPEPRPDPNPDPFPGAVVHLGALGIVTAITLRVEPTFQVRQVVYENLSFDQLAQHFNRIVSAAYSVSLFTDWQHHRITQVWVKSRVDPNQPPPPIARDFFGAAPATRPLHPLPGLSPESCTEQLGIPGPWHERLPHFRTDFTPSSGQELQSEFFVPLRHAVAAIQAIEHLHHLITPHLLISELRTVAADDLWLSPCYHQTSLALHFTWKPEWDAVQHILPLIEAALEPFGAKPHWAKLFTTDPPPQRNHPPPPPHIQAPPKQLDPQGKLLNDYLTTNLHTAYPLAHPALTFSRLSFRTS